MKLVMIWTLLSLTKCGITPKKTAKLWVLFAVHRASRRIVAFEIGSRGAKALKRLLAKLSLYNVRLFTADEWSVYRKLIPANRLIQSKKGTYTVNKHEHENTSSSGKI